MARGDSPHVRLGDRVVAAEDDRDRAGRDDLRHESLDRGVRSHRIGGHHRGVAEVDDAKHLVPVDLRLEMRARRATGGPDRARPEARSRPVRDEVVGRRADDRDVDAGELGRILRIGQAGEREQPGVVRLVRQAELAPALERIDHGPDPMRRCVGIYAT